MNTLTTTKETTIAPAALISSQIRKIVRDREQADVATLQFTGLDAAMRAAGADWPQRWSRLRRLAESFIRGRLAADDILVRGPDGFTIAFSERGGAGIVDDVAALTRRLNNRLAMEPPPHAQIAFTVRSIGVPDLAMSIARGTPGSVLAKQPQSMIIPSLGEVAWRFHPVWDVRREIVSCYFASPHHADSGERVRGYQYEDPGLAMPDFSDLDAESVRTSEHALQEMHEQGKRVLIGMSLHASTLENDAGLERILSLLDGGNPVLAAYRLIKVTGIGADASRTRLRTIIEALRERASRVVISAAWHEADVAGLVQCGPTAFGFAYPDRVAGALSASASGTLMARFGSGVELAHSVGIPLYVEGAIGPHLAKEFRAVGADYICSPVIWTPRPTPDAVLRWPASMLPN